MSDKLREIQNAIDTFQMDTARRLLRDELQDNPTADTYYMASQAAINHGQRVEFLEKAIELDPFHRAAHDELAGIVPPDMDARAIPLSVGAPKATTPVSPAHQQATIQQRLVARLIDWLIVGVIGAIFGGVYGALSGVSLPPYEATDPAYIDAFVQIQLSVMVISILINAVYHIYFMVRTNGQTPGKQMIGIRAVKKDDTPFNFMDALMRNVIGYMLSSIFFIGYIWALFDSEQQGWHDKIAGTVVIVDQQQSNS